MRTCIALTVIVSVAGLSPCSLRAQGQTGIPGLSFTTSPQGNGMGGMAATIPTSDPSATIANPGQLGLFSLENLLGASTYAPKTDLLPSSPLPPPFGVTITVSALNAGFNLKELLSLPFSAGVGLGYSRTFVDMGTFSVTSSTGPQVIGTASANETYENYSVGLGLEYLVRLGIGMNFKKITSILPGVGVGGDFKIFTATPSAADFGILLEVPFVAIVSEVSGTSLSLAKGIEPFLNTSMSYVKSNFGDEVWYLDPAQPDPLPRTAVIGLGIEGGFSAKAGNANWRMISFALAHQAEDVLVTRFNDGTFVYKEGLGDLRFGENVLVGRVTGNVLVRKGWQIGAAEVLYIRGGSVKGYGYDYSTSGYSICLGGLVKLLESASPEMAGTSWVAFIGDHIDVQYHSAAYTAPGTWSDGSTYKGLNLVVHGFPW